MTASSGVNTARVVRAAATIPEICYHNVRLGQGCFCPRCPTALFEPDLVIQETSKTESFDADLARLSEIRELDTWGTQRGKDVPFLLELVDKLWAEYCRTLNELDRLPVETSEYCPGQIRDHRWQITSEGNEWCPDCFAHRTVAEIVETPAPTETIEGVPADSPVFEGELRAWIEKQAADYRISLFKRIEEWGAKTFSVPPINPSGWGFTKEEEKAWVEGAAQETTAGTGTQDDPHRWVPSPATPSEDGVMYIEDAPGSHAEKTGAERLAERLKDRHKPIDLDEVGQPHLDETPPLKAGAIRSCGCMGGWCVKRHEKWRLPPGVQCFQENGRESQS